MTQKWPLPRKLHKRNLWGKIRWYDTRYETKLIVNIIDEVRCEIKFIGEIRLILLMRRKQTVQDETIITDRTLNCIILLYTSYVL